MANVDQVIEATDGQARVELTTGPVRTNFVFTDTAGSVPNHWLNMSYGVNYVLLTLQLDFGEFDLLTIRQADGTSITWEQ